MAGTSLYPPGILHTRPRTLLVLGMLVALLVAGAVSSSAQASGLRGRMLNTMNRVRTHHNVGRLRLNVDLSHDAHRHSRSMAARGALFHTVNLATRVRPYHATRWGENVAKAGTLRRVMRMWMRSASHRANVLRRSFHHAGVGVVRSRGWMWVTVIYYG